MVDEEQLRRYLQLGMAFTQMTRAKAEQALRDLSRARAGDGPAAQAVLDDLLDWSRRNAEAAFEMVRGEATRQFEAMGVTSVDDLASLLSRLAGRAPGWSGRPGGGSGPGTAQHEAASRPAGGEGTRPSGEGPAKKAPAKKSGPKKSATKKSATKKAATKKAATKQTPAKRARATKKTSRKKAGATRTAGSKKARATSTPAKASTRSRSRKARG